MSTHALRINCKAQDIEVREALQRIQKGVNELYVPYVGAITNVDLGAYNLTTTGLGTFGNLDVDTLNFNGNAITDSTGTISFDDENLTTTGTGTFGEIVDNGLTATRLLASDGSKQLVSTNLNSWVTGTANEITVTDDGDGTITLDIPDAVTLVNLTVTDITIGANTLDTNEWAFLDGQDQSVFTTSSPTFAGLTISTNGKINFRDSAIGIYSQADSYLDIFADGGIRIGDSSAGAPTNYVSFAPDGEINLHGTARVWKNVELSPDNIGLPSANPPAQDEYQGFSFDRYDRSTEEQVYFIWHIPDDFAVGDASARGHFGFFVENPPVGTGDEVVVMGFEYKKISPDDVFNFAAGTSSGTISETIDDAESAYTWHETSAGSVTTTGWAVGDIILFRFYRDATNVNDTYDNEAVAADNDVWVGIYHLEYLSDKLGEAI